MFMPSLAHRYTVRPDPLVRNAPAEPAWVVITVPVVDALAELPAAGAELAGAEGEAAALLHAAASSAEASGIPSLTGLASSPVVSGSSSSFPPGRRCLRHRVCVTRPTQPPSVVA